MKDIYFNENVYFVPKNTVKFINGLDVAKIGDNLIVFWSDVDQKWKEADIELQAKYLNCRLVNLKKGNELIKIMLDNNNAYTDNGVAHGFAYIKEHIKCIDSEKNVWEIID